jgi:hypothetical protein
METLSPINPMTGPNALNMAVSPEMIADINRIGAAVMHEMAQTNFNVNALPSVNTFDSVFSDDKFNKFNTAPVDAPLNTAEAADLGGMTLEQQMELKHDTLKKADMLYGKGTTQAMANWQHDTMFSLAADAAKRMHDEDEK